MTQRPRRRAIALAVALATLDVPLVAEAAGGEAPAAAPAAKKKKKGAGAGKASPSAPLDADAAEAKRLFLEANRLFDSGQFEKALAIYTAAYEKKPLPAFLVNIAQCHRNLGNFEQSIFFYKKFLSEVPDSPLKDAIGEVVKEMEVKEAAKKKAEAERVAAEKAEAEKEAELARKERATMEASAALDAAAAARLSAEAAKARLEAARKKMFYKRPWFWSLVGGLVVAGAAAGLTVFVVGNVYCPALGETTQGCTNDRGAF